MEGSSKKEKELVDTDNSVVIAGVRGVDWGGRGCRGDKCSWKKYNKIKMFKLKNISVIAK